MTGMSLEPAGAELPDGAVDPLACWPAGAESAAGVEAVPGCWVEGFVAGGFDCAVEQTAHNATRKIPARLNNARFPIGGNIIIPRLRREDGPKVLRLFLKFCEEIL